MTWPATCMNGRPIGTTSNFTARIQPLIPEGLQKDQPKFSVVGHILTARTACVRPSVPRVIPPNTTQTSAFAAHRTCQRSRRHREARLAPRRSPLPDKTMKRYRVKPASRLSLKEHDPDDTGDYKKNDQGKAAAK